jgi:hypothetical protein
MKKIIFFLIIFFFSKTVFSQDYYAVSGKVIDSATRAPLQSASVFAQNTTFGTITDAQGNFKLVLPNGGYSLVVTFTGYSTEASRISSTDTSIKNMLIEMKEKDKSLEAVAVVATTEVKDGWDRYGFFFTDNFIGKTTFGNNCHLLNNDALKFYFSKRKNRLKVLASAPLEIQNDALGYNIKYTLDSFTYDYTTQTTVYTGYPLFEEMKPAGDSQEQQWKANRMQAYKGSILHFMRSVYNKTLTDEGFEIQFIVNNDGRDTAIHLKNFYGALNYDKDDSSSTVEIKPNQNNMAVVYKKAAPEQNYLNENDDALKKYQLSFLTFAQPLSIESNGYYFEQNDITVTGYWSWQKIANMVPYDFVPQ